MVTIFFNKKNTHSTEKFNPIVLRDFEFESVDRRSVESFPIYLDRVHCKGDESNLLQCANWGVGSSYSKRKVAIRCLPKGKIRFLVCF